MTDETRRKESIVLVSHLIVHLRFARSSALADLPPEYRNEFRATFLAIVDGIRELELREQTSSRH